jgi:hypothetical protein
MCAFTSQAALPSQISARIFEQDHAVFGGFDLGPNQGDASFHSVGEIEMTDRCHSHLNPRCCFLLIPRLKPEVRQYFVKGR